MEALGAADGTDRRREAESAPDVREAAATKWLRRDEKREAGTNPDASGSANLTRQLRSQLEELNLTRQLRVRTAHQDLMPHAMVRPTLS